MSEFSYIIYLSGNVVNISCDVTLFVNSTMQCFQYSVQKDVTARQCYRIIREYITRQVVTFARSHWIAAGKFAMSCNNYN